MKMENIKIQALFLRVVMLSKVFLWKDNDDDDERDWYQLLCPEPNLDIGDLNSKSPLF